MEKGLNYKLLIDSPDFENPKPELEQYSTPVDIAIDFVKKVNSRGLLEGKVADLGCGTGRLAIGATMLGANVTGFEIDQDALNMAIDYSKGKNLNINWICGAVENIIEEFDTVIMNPPFGSQRPGADRIFLEKALEISNHIWTIHIANTRDFIEKLVEKKGGEIEMRYEFDFPISRSMPFHSKEVENQKAILYHIASLR